MSSHVNSTEYFCNLFAIVHILCIRLLQGIETLRLLGIKCLFD